MDLTELIQIAAIKGNCSPEEVTWYSWPQVFPTTAGPKGTGGCAMTTFQVIAFELPNGERIRTCAGVWRHWSGEFMQHW